MSRLAPMSLEEMTADQRRVFEAISSTRPNALGPFSVLFRTPSFAEPANALHNAYRLAGTLDRRLFEMMILLVSHEYRAKYVWTFHIGQSLKAGVSKETIDAIDADRTLRFKSEEEELCATITLQLLRDKTVNDSAYQRGIDVFGEPLLIELVSAVGFYSMICLIVNAFDVPPLETAAVR